jgi:hypothetical protein
MPRVASNSPLVGSEEKMKNISEKVGKFLAFEIDHKSGRIHHNFTTKKPPLCIVFSKTTLKNTSKTAGLRQPVTPNIFENLCRILREIAHPEHMEVLEPGLEHIDQPVVSIRVRRPQKKASLQHKVSGIADDSFNHLAIVEVNSHPETRHRRRMFMKMQCPVAKVSIEGLDEKDRLRVLRRHIFHGVGIQQPQSNRIKRIDRVVSQQLFDRP